MGTNATTSFENCLAALAPQLERSGSIHCERLRSGNQRVVLRLREYREGTSRNRSIALHGVTAADLPALRRRIVELQQGRWPERGWPDEPRRVMEVACRAARCLRPRDRRAIGAWLRATGGDFRLLLWAVLCLPGMLAERQRRRRGGRPRKDHRRPWAPVELLACVKTAPARERAPSLQRL